MIDKNSTFHHDYLKKEDPLCSSQNDVPGDHDMIIFINRNIG